LREQHLVSRLNLLDQFGKLPGPDFGCDYHAAYHIRGRKMGVEK
jgi:hypothetical protein